MFRFFLISPEPVNLPSHAKMTINHIFLVVSHSHFQSLAKFYATILTPLSHTVYHSSPTLIGLGSDYPDFWLKATAPETKTVPTHIAFDAKDHQAVDDFYRIALQAGAKDNGLPGIRKEMGIQPYYAAFVVDEEGNNIEAVCVDRGKLHATVLE